MKFEIYFNGFDENDPQTWNQNRMLVEANDQEIVKAFIKKAFPDTNCGFAEVDTEENGIKLEKPYSSNKPFVKREYPCQAWQPEQMTEESESVCYHCGWTKPNHGEINDSVQIWWFKDQDIPKQIKNLSYCGGDEDWVISSTSCETLGI